MGASAAAKATGNLNDGLLKFIIYTEIQEEQLEEVLNNQELLNKCDAIALLYENDTDHLAYITDNFRKLPKLVPKVLIQTKTDMQQPGQEIMFIEDFAR